VAYVPPASAISNSSFCVYGFRRILTVNSENFLKQHFQADLCNGGVFFAVRTEFLNIIQGMDTRDLTISIDTPQGCKRV
jgi:hypothetical protein